MHEIYLGDFQKTFCKDAWGCHGTDPYAIAFCYTPKKSFVIKGMLSNVHQELEKHPKCVYYLSLWRNGRSRGFWRSTNRRIMFTSTQVGKRLKHKVIINAPNCKDLLLRRIPRKWLPEYDAAF